MPILVHLFVRFSCSGVMMQEFGPGIALYKPNLIHRARVLFLVFIVPHPKENPSSLSSLPLDFLCGLKAFQHSTGNSIRRGIQKNRERRRKKQP